MIDPDRLYTEDEVAEIASRAPSTLQKDRCAGRGFRFRRQGRSVRYLGRDLLEDIEGLPTFTSTAEAPKPARRAQVGNQDGRRVG